MRVVKARIEPSLGAHVIARTPLFYARGADVAVDRPAHVRAGSALARIGPRTLAVVQDDASFVAVLDEIGGARVVVRDIALPSHDGARQFDDSRGNKKAKLDLEACLASSDGAQLVALGSGSSEVRERAVIVDLGADGEPRVSVVHAHEIYAAMRNEPGFCGSELNVEGAAWAGNDVLFFQRGNGAMRGQHTPVDATARVDASALFAYLRGLAQGEPAYPACPACPPLRQITAWELGALGGTRLTFTDGARRSERWTGFLACAEASPDATRDGPVAGVAMGRLDDRAAVAELAPIRDERGAVLVDKAEGLAFDEDEELRAWVVVDRDDPLAPAELLELRLGEGWRS